MNTFTNPVIEGFSPDPSVCAVGEDFYLVTSTFAYFPGIPIYHSKDLVNWTQIGNVLTTEEQLNLKDTDHSQGIFAPTIRYNDGTFYVTTTNVTHGGNFVVTAEDPAGPWSEPYFIDNSPGIDSSLFFDDGRCYYIGTRPNPTGPTYNGDWEVWLQEFDLETLQLTGVSTKIWEGAMKNAIWPEGPHIYIKDGYYYLLIAEGGTGYNHSITIARSENVDGPYIGNKNNPIITHRHLGKDFPVHNVGHGDLVQATDGSWYLTCLASRVFDGYNNLGREVFLAEVKWEDGWPVINPGVGRLLEEQEHKLPLYPKETKETWTFEEKLPEFLFLRHPFMENYDNESREGWLRLNPTPVTIHEIDSPTYMSIRQDSMWYDFSTHIDFQLNEDGEAGIVILQSNTYSIRLVASKTSENTNSIKMITTIDGEEKIVGSTDIEENDFVLKLTGTGQKLKGVIEVNEEEIIVAENIEAHYLSTAVAGGFVGCTLGIYATSPNEDPGYADFEWMKLIDNSK